MRRITLMVLVVAAGMTAGCPLPSYPETPAAVFEVTEPATGQDYWLYVPSNYSEDRQWPLVVTLHGTFGYDGGSRQAKEWKYVAEKCGFLVAAPELKSVQGVLPVPDSMRRSDLAADDRLILAMLDEVCAKYKVDREAVMLTGFSAGGFPMWNTGLRHPERFNMVIARNCNFDVDLIRDIEFTDATRKLAVKIYWGKDDVWQIKNDGWAALEFLRRQRQCYQVTYRKIPGGHFRKPAKAYNFWLERLPKKYHPAPGSEFAPPQ